MGSASLTTLEYVDLAERVSRFYDHAAHGIAAGETTFRAFAEDTTWTTVQVEQMPKAATLSAPLNRETTSSQIAMIRALLESLPTNPYPAGCPVFHAQRGGKRGRAFVTEDKGGQTLRIRVGSQTFGVAREYVSLDLESLVRNAERLIESRRAAR